MGRLQLLKFYVSGHLAKPALRMCALAVRGLWMEMLSLMHLNAQGLLARSDRTPGSLTWCPIAVLEQWPPRRVGRNVLG